MPFDAAGFDPPVLPAEIFPKAPVRAADLVAVIDRLQRRQHCAILGASNMGKSALLNSLTTPAARITCRTPGEDANQDPIFVFVDFLEVAHSEHSFYELLLRRIVDDFEYTVADASAELTQSLRVIHENLVHESNDVAIRSAFANGIRRLMHETSHRIILILDEFDDGFRTLPPWPFRHLRAVANAQEDLQYIVATTHRLADLREDDETYEFRELFQMNVLELQPLDDADSVRFVTYLDRRYGNALAPSVSELIRRLASGHPGILERLYEVCYSGVFAPPIVADSLSLDAACQTFCAEPSIEKECNRLWNELEETERATILALTGSELAHDSETLPTAPLQALQRKGIVTSKSGELFSPLFAYFVRSRKLNQPATSASPTIESNHVPPTNPIRSGIYCDLESGRIWVNDQEITWELGSEHQRKLVIVLFSRAGTVCSYDEIAEAVWGVGEGVTPAAIRELVNRTRRKLPDPDAIVNVSGKGYRLLFAE